MRNGRSSAISFRSAGDHSRFQYHHDARQRAVDSAGADHPQGDPVARLEAAVQAHLVVVHHGNALAARPGYFAEDAVPPSAADIVRGVRGAVRRQPVLTARLPGVRDPLIWHGASPSGCVLRREDLSLPEMAGGYEIGWNEALALSGSDEPKMLNLMLGRASLNEVSKVVKTRENHANIIEGPGLKKVSGSVF